MSIFKSRKALAGLGLAVLQLLTYFPIRAQGGTELPSNVRLITLWVRETNGQALYWVNDAPVGREPLSGLVSVIKPNEQVRVVVILDSRVPIQEMGEIDGVLAKIPVEGAHYYVYDAAHPKGMSEIIWRSQLQPLPASPPR